MTPADLLRRGRIVVASPHLDDAALSLGATIARATRSGAEVAVLTVLAGDPASRSPAGPSDADCGFSSAGESARERRKEDLRACEILGATADWLPFSDDQYERGGTDDEVWSAIAPKLADVDVVLVPGYPLTHPDHAWLARLLVARVPADIQVALYVEQPYANLQAIGRGYTSGPILRAAGIALRTPAGRRLQTPRLPETIAGLVRSPVDWVASGTSRRDRRAKCDSLRAYESQLEGLGRRLFERIRLYEWAWGGEGIGLPHGIRHSTGSPVGGADASG